jgi:hypothetical protein
MFASAMLPRLYEDRSRDRYALVNIGRVLTAKITVEAIPATVGASNVDMEGR